MPAPPENDPYRVEVFTELVDTEFTVELENGSTMALKLVEVRNQSRLAEGATLPDGSPIYQRTPFSVTFTGPKTPLLPQRLYPVSHPEFGRHDFFIKPIFENADTVYYETVFN